jgi:hypothetical protein
MSDTLCMTVSELEVCRMSSRPDMMTAIESLRSFFCRMSSRPDMLCPTRCLV